MAEAECARITAVLHRGSKQNLETTPLRTVQSSNFISFLFIPLSMNLYQAIALFCIVEKYSNKFANLDKRKNVRKVFNK